MKIIYQDDNRLKLRVQPTTGYFFGGAQLILGCCFLYIYFQPGSSQWSIGIALFFIGLGLLTLLLSTTVSITIDKQNDCLTLHRKNRVKTDQINAAITDIGQITVQGSGGLNQDRYWDIVLQFKNGQTLLLTPTSTDSEKQMKIANLIDIFLEFKLYP